MSDTPFIFGANGLIATPNWNPEGYQTGQNGFSNLSPGIDPNGSGNVTATSGPGPWTAVQQLPGANIQLVGSGEYDFLSTSRSPQLAIGNGNSAQVSGTRGSIQVDFITGALSAPTLQGLAFIVGNTGPTVTTWLGICWVTSSGAIAFGATNSAGQAIIGPTFPTNTTIPANTRATVQVYWDAPLGLFAIYINGQRDTAVFAQTPWGPFVPTAILYGNGSGITQAATPVGAFDGTILNVQVSPSPGPVG